MRNLRIWLKLLIFQELCAYMARMNNGDASEPTPESVFSTEAERKAAERKKRLASLRANFTEKPQQTVESDENTDVDRDACPLGDMVICL